MKIAFLYAKFCKIWEIAEIYVKKKCLDKLFYYKGPSGKQRIDLIGVKLI